jgi:radical SAM protein with 4Fe4S-binding SPASM domain
MTEIDNHKLMYHPERVAEWKVQGDCFPVYVEIGPTNRCNHKCVFCALDWVEHGSQDIDKDVMIRNLEDMASHGVKSIMFAGEGEPLLHKNICDFVETARGYGMDVSLTTNGVMFNKEKADRILKHFSWVRFSIDAGTRQSYSKIHRTRESDFDKMLDNLKYASELKKEKGYNVTIGTQILLLSLNQDEILEAAKLLKQNGADNLQIKPYSHHPLSRNDYSLDYKKIKGLNERLQLVADEKFKVFYREHTMERMSDKRSYTECAGLSFFTLIDAKGNVIPCNLFYNNNDFTYGNLNKNSFSEIWEGERRKGVLAKLRERGVKSCREGCRLDTVNRYLHRLKYPEEHDNFI